MSILHFTTIAVVASFMLADPLPLYAQSQSDQDEQNNSDGDNGFGGDPEGEGEPVAPSRSSSPSSATTSTTTATVVASLNSATSYCKLISSAYAIDCVAERLGAVAEQLKGQEGFEEVQAVLEATSRDLSKIARQNRSDTLAPAAFSTQGSNPIKTTRRLVPVDDAKLDTAVSQALAVIGQAETLLLRSAEQSADRAIQFQQIAAAIGSNKVLLRSL